MTRFAFEEPAPLAQSNAPFLLEPNVRGQNVKFVKADAPIWANLDEIGLPAARRIWTLPGCRDRTVALRHTGERNPARLHRQRRWIAGKSLPVGHLHRNSHTQARKIDVLLPVSYLNLSRYQLTC
jgi:hypothetical protein